MPDRARSSSEKRCTRPPNSWNRIRSFHRPATIASAASIPSAAVSRVHGGCTPSGALLTSECVLVTTRPSLQVGRMSRNLPSSILRYVEGANAHDADQASSLFAEDAVVHDEARDHVGRPAIREWVQDTIDRYATKFVVERVSESSDATMVVVRISGSFPGSPAKVRFLFQLADGLITHLDIKS